MPIPNKIKYSTTLTDGTIKVGNFILGVTDGASYGPTSQTGFYQGLSPNGGGYTVYQNKATLGPSTFAPSNDNDFITLVKTLSGLNITGVTQALTYLNTQSDIIAVNKDYPNTPTSELSVCLDPSFIPSYPTSGTSFNNLGKSATTLTFTLNNGVNYSSDAGGSLLFDGVDDEVTSNAVYRMTSGMTWDVWFKKTSTGNTFNMVMSSFIPYISFRSNMQFHCSWYTVSGGTPTQRNVYSTTTYNTNTWYNVNFTLLNDVSNNISTGKMYVNGILNNVTTGYTESTYQPSTPQRLRLGNYFSNLYPFPGYIGRFLVYDRILSDAEILNNYNNSKIPYLISGYENYVESEFGVFESQNCQINILQKLNSI